MEKTLSITPNGALMMGATGPNRIAAGSTTTIASNGSNDIGILSGDRIRYQADSANI